METATKNEIVKINPADFGVEESKAQQIAEQFKPMLDKMVELEAEYNEVLKLDIDDPMTTFKAKEVRLKYVKVRTGTAAIHKAQKDFYLQAGRFVDGWKNAQLFASQGIEEKLSAIELHYENKEKARIAALNEARLNELKQFEFDGSQMNLGSMDEAVWTNFLSGTKLQYEAKKAEEKKIELAKIEAENAAIRERARIEEENKKLKAEAKAKEKALEIERAKAKKELEAKEALRLAEQKKADALLETQRKQAEAKLKKEREAKEKIEAELRAKQEVERKAEAEKQAEIKAKQLADAKALKAPDKDKLIAWINNVSLSETLELKSNESVTVAANIQLKFDAFKNWANEQINNL